jgi:two-component system cell cycle response regulator
VHNDRSWLWYAGFGGAALTGYVLLTHLPVPAIVPVLWYTAISVSGAVALVLGVRRHRPLRRLPWYLLAGGQALYASADFCFYLMRSVYGLDQYPSYDDLLYLASYPMLTAGLVAFVRARTPSWDLPALLDSLIVTIVAALLLWVYVVSEVAAAEDGMLARSVSIAYPSMDLLLITVALRLAMGPGARSVSFRLLLAAIFTMFTADVGYGYLELNDAYVPGGILEVLWLLVVLGFGAAALHPSMVGMTRPAQVAGPQLTPVRLGLLTAASFTAPVLLLAQRLSGSAVDVVAGAVSCMLLFSLTLARMGVLANAHRRMADTDVLTGLRNRRSFTEALAAYAGPDAVRRPGLSLLLLDIDHFKQVNDTYGHDGGDRVLAAIGGLLRSCVRDGDIVARYGGEEFAVLAPGLSAAELDGLAERIRHTVATTAITVGPDLTATVTVSVGGVRRDDLAEQPTAVLSHADRRLYAAKNGGRNRAVTVDDELVTPPAAQPRLPVRAG